MVTLYVDGKKVEIEGADIAIRELPIGSQAIEVRNDSGKLIARFVRVDEDPAPLIVEERRD